MTHMRKKVRFGFAAALAVLWTLSVKTATAQSTFTIVHTGIDYAERGENLAITATIQPKSQLQYAAVFFRRAGNASYSTAFMKDQGSFFVAELPKEQVTKFGIEYYISVTDKSGGEHVLFATPTEPYYISTKVVAILQTRQWDQYQGVIDGVKTEIKSKIVTYDMNSSDDQGRVILNQLQKAASPPDLIIAVGRQAAELCRDSVKDIPVVFTMVPSPYKLGLKTNNMTGISVEVPVKSQLIMFKSVVPNVKRVGVIYNPEKTGDIIGQARFIAPSLGFQIVEAKVEQAEDVSRALRAFSEGIDAFWLVPDSTIVKPFSVKIILDYTLQNKIPLFVYEKFLVDAGALVAISPNLLDMGKRTGEMARKILRGADPSTFTILNPEELKVTLNWNTARQIGVQDTVARQLILYAAERQFPIETVGQKFGP